MIFQLFHSLFRRQRIVTGAILLALLLPAGSVPGAAAPKRIQGTIEQSDANSLTIRSADGGESILALSSSTLVLESRPSRLDAIKPGDYVASAATKGDDGKLHSTELRIFPEALRGLGEGQRPMAKPNTTMTNAAVSEVMAAPQGRVLKVKFSDGESELLVGPEVPITILVVTDLQALKVGGKVTVLAEKDAAGRLEAKRIFTN